MKRTRDRLMLSSVASVVAGTRIPRSLTLKLLVAFFLLTLPIVATGVFAFLEGRRQVAYIDRILGDSAAINLVAHRAISAAQSGAMFTQKALRVARCDEPNTLRGHRAGFDETAAEFGLFISALTWGTESAAFRGLQGGSIYNDWIARGLYGRVIILEVSDELRQLAGLADLYYSGFSKHTVAAIVDTESSLHEGRVGDEESAAAERASAAAHARLSERYEHLVEQTLSRLIARTEENTEMAHVSIRQTQIVHNFLAVAIFVFPFLFSLVLLGIFLQRHLVNPLTQLVVQTHKIAVGHSAFDLPLDRKDEVGDIARGFERMVRELHRSQKKLKKAVVAAQRRTQLIDRISARRKKALEDLEATQEQLIHAQKMEAIGRLAGGVAHDFNNLLVVIIGCATFAKQTLVNSNPAYTEVNEILTSAMHAAALTRQLLTFSRREVVETKIVNLNDLVVSVDTLLRRVVGEDVEISTRLVEQGWWVNIDTMQFEQVLLNLVINARDAMPGGGKLLIETKNMVLTRDSSIAVRPEPGPYAVLAVSDTGSGMSAATRARIFEPFFTTKEHGKGTGLGLATCYGIIRRAGGGIEVESELGRGTTFTIYLPRAENPKAVGAPLGSERSTGGSETVLLVEDESRVREMEVRILTNLGYNVLQASDGPSAVARGERYSGPIHLLLTDVVMPKMDGVELASLLRTSRPDLRVLFVSGYAGPHDLTAQLAEFQGILPKPFAADEMARKVREVLDA